MPAPATGAATQTTRNRAPKNLSARIATPSCGRSQGDRSTFAPVLRPSGSVYHGGGVNVRNLRGKLLISLLLGVVVFAGLTFYADFTDVIHSLGAFRWELLPLILLLSSGNYVFRFIKWEYYLRLIGVRGLSKRDSFLVYFSGLGMVITPGKVGEWLKSYLLREVHGTPISRSAPILVAERLTDSIALLIIAAAGIFVFGHLWQIFVVVALGVVAIVAVARHRPTAMALLALGKRLPLVRRFIPQLEEFY